MPVQALCHQLSCCTKRTGLHSPIHSRQASLILLPWSLLLLLQVAMEKGLSPQQAAQALAEEALSAHSVTPATRDNITVLVVQFAPMPN